MQKISIDQLYTLNLKDKGSKNEAVHTALNQMQVGEALIIKRNEWKSKNNPSSTSLKQSIKYQGTLTIRTLADESGWVIIKQ